MIFKAELSEKVLAGTKTQTRRPISGNPRSPYFPSFDDRGSVPMGCEVGRDYAVSPGRGKRSIGRIKITDVRRERWRDITEDDAVREGFKAITMPNGLLRSARSQFLDYVVAMYPNLDLDSDVWVIDFELVSTLKVVGS